MKGVCTHLGKDVLLPLRLSTGMYAAGAAIQKKIYGSGCLSDLLWRITTLISSNEEMEDIMKVVKSVEESGLIIKGISETIKGEAKEQKGEFLSILLGTLGAKLLRSTLTRKWVIRQGKDTIGAAGQDF